MSGTNRNSSLASQIRHRGVVALVLALSGCGGERPSAPEVASPAPLAVTVDVLGEGCAAGLTLATTVTNASASPVRLDRLTLKYATEDARCRSHQAPIDGALAEVLAPGEGSVVHRIDPKGTLCEPPTGAFGCVWRVTADVTSSVGTASGSTAFEAAGPGRLAGSGEPQAVVLVPQAGAVLSGIAPVQPNFVEGCGKNITARMKVFLFRGTQVLAASGDLDFGDSWSLDTTRFADGAYSLGAIQNGCVVLGPLTPVSIRN